MPVPLMRPIMRVLGWLSPTTYGRKYPPLLRETPEIVKESESPERAKLSWAVSRYTPAVTKQAVLSVGLLRHDVFPHELRGPAAKPTTGKVEAVYVDPERAKVMLPLLVI